VLEIADRFSGGWNLELLCAEAMIDGIWVASRIGEVVGCQLSGSEAGRAGVPILRALGGPAARSAALDVIAGSTAEREQRFKDIKEVEECSVV
jgi:hypothetical protein